MTTRRNIRYGAVNQFFVEAAMTLSEGTMVLPLLVRGLGGSTFLAGLLPSVLWFGWLGPQFLVAGPLQQLRRFLPVTRYLELVRSLLYLALGGIVLTWGASRPGLALSLFFPLFAISRCAAGSSAVARNELVARIVPAQDRPTLVSMRRLAGGVAGLLAGIAVRYILDARHSSFPNNYATLLLLSGVSFGVAIVTLRGIVERDSPIKPVELGLSQQIRRAPTILRKDVRFSGYIGMRTAASGLTLAAPFYILYATEVLGAPAAMAGVYIALRTLALVLSNLFWGNQVKARGSLWVMQRAFVLGAIAPLLVVIVAVAKALTVESNFPSFVIWAFGLVFLVQGLATSASGIGEVTYLYEIAPERDRPSYFGLTNTILGPVHFLPALGGALVGVAGFVPIFVGAAALMGVAYSQAAKLQEAAPALHQQPARELIID